MGELPHTLLHVVAWHGPHQTDESTLFLVCGRKHCTVGCAMPPHGNMFRVQCLADVEKRRQSRPSAGAMPKRSSSLLQEHKPREEVIVPLPVPHSLTLGTHHSVLERLSASSCEHVSDKEVVRALHTDSSHPSTKENQEWNSILLAPSGMQGSSGTGNWGDRQSKTIIALDEKVRELHKQLKARVC
jgi:hypothetical protein